MCRALQTGLNLMLKKCYKEGAAARAAGRPSLGLGPEGSGACGAGDPAASEAAMLSLLEEEASEERVRDRKRKKKRRLKPDAEAVSAALAAAAEDAVETAACGDAAGAGATAAVSHSAGAVAAAPRENGHHAIELGVAQRSSQPAVPLPGTESSDAAVRVSYAADPSAGAASRTAPCGRQVSDTVTSEANASHQRTLGSKPCANPAPTANRRQHEQQPMSHQQQEQPSRNPGEPASQPSQFSQPSQPRKHAQQPQQQKQAKPSQPQHRPKQPSYPGPSAPAADVASQGMAATKSTPVAAGPPTAEPGAAHQDDVRAELQAQLTAASTLLDVGAAAGEEATSQVLGASSLLLAPALYACRACSMPALHMLCLYILRDSDFLCVQNLLQQAFNLRLSVKFLCRLDQMKWPYAAF